MVGERDRGAEAGAAEARGARDQRLARLQLLPRARRLLGGARPARGVAARADAGGVGHLPGARDVPGVGLGRRSSRREAYGAGSGHRPDVGVPGFDGHGVTIALLDTGVDASHPYLHGRVLPGIDMSNAAPIPRRARTRRTLRSSSGTARSSPASSSARTARRASAASRPRRASCRSASRAGRRPPTAASSCTAGATS